MYETIRNLYHGNITPNEENYSMNSDYQNSLKEMCAQEEQLKKILDSDTFKLFEKFTETRNIYGSAICEESFVQGFRLGAMMMLEILNDNKV